MPRVNDSPVALTAAQMREADRRCIEDIGIPGVVLMDHAGKAVWKNLDGRRVGIVCGKGNNGGDGYVVARYALLAGREVRLVLLAAPDTITGDARIFLDAYRRLGGELTVATGEASAREAVAALGNCDVLVDAILGTGIEGEVRGVAKAAIEAWPGPYTVAVDIPSGLNADTGEPCGCAIRAELTVTFQCPKRGFLHPASREYTGEVIVADIGIPSCCITGATA
ncbi:MAG: hypothetical protein RLZZ303_1682 [Candidatus Hydrogenedentota bacterium]|jgi:NAD(P)H-hydrate epimerase